MKASCHFERRYQSRFAGAVGCTAFPLDWEGCQMKTPNPTKAELSAPNRPKFTGTDNPRQLRVLYALLTRPRRREDVDSIAGCSNGPELVAELRRRGLEVPCERIRFVDRDGFPCRPGVYSFTASDRRAIYTWFAKCRKGGAHA
jgi:hypothetical protein